MTATSKLKQANDSKALHPSPDPDAVSEQLERILASDEFRTSAHLCDFLRFIVEETLAGRSAKIKGYSIAVSVFKRPEDFDPADDPIVRIYAGKLRRALAYYYSTNGERDLVRIRVAKGHYLPTFSLATPHSAHARRSLRVEPPSIVVLPLANLSGDPQQAYFADGVTEEVVVKLTRCADIEVSAEPAPLDLRWSDVNVREVAKSWNVRFVLGGTVRRSSDRVRVTVQLRDGISGGQLWADSYERTLTADNLFAVQDEVARRVVTKVADQYEGAINRTLLRELSYRTHSVTTYDAVLRLNHYKQNVSYDAYVRTLRGLEEAVATDPDYAMAWAGLGELQLVGYMLGYSAAERDAALSRTFTLVRKALALEPNGEYAHFVLGMVYLAARDRESLLRESETLIELGRQPSAKALGACLLALAGYWDRGKRLLVDLMQSLSRLPGWLHNAMFLNEYRQGNYDAAYREALKFNMPMHLWDPVMRAAALGQLGRTREARGAIGEVLGLRPDFGDHPARYLECLIMQDKLVQHVLDGLRKGGL